MTFNLDGSEWLVATDAKNEGLAGKWFKAPRPEAKSIDNPTTLHEAFPNYHGLVWEWRSFKAPKNPCENGRSLLRFWSVDYKCDAWLNGEKIGEHEDAEEPFIIDVTDTLKPGKENLLALRILNPTHERIDGITLNETAHGAKILPHTAGLEWNFGGVLDSVELLSTPSARVERLHLLPDWKTGEIKVEAELFNYGKKAVAASLRMSVATSVCNGEIVDELELEKTLEAGRCVWKGKLKVPQHRLWTLDDPFLYRVSTRLQVKGSEFFDELSERIGFRFFDYENGCFRLNGKRVFIRSAHSLWTTPVKLHSNQDLAMIRRDVLFAKAMGFNAIRFLPFAASRCHLDLCDELGVMVMQQSASSWLLADSPKMKENFDRSILGVVRRDWNHPCITIWYILNETCNGPVFDYGVEVLQKVRKLDATRVCLLNSGRFDHREKEIGSVCRPGSKVWEEMNDVHSYMEVPHHQTEIANLRGFTGLLSEYGIASVMDLPALTRRYEMRGATACMDALHYRDKLDKFMVDWRKWKLDELFGRPEDFFKTALAKNAAQRTIGLNAIRSNPALNGYSMTALHDEVSSGEGPIDFFRELKPGMVDAIRDGFAPLRWCLFSERELISSGDSVLLEAVLANEDVLRPGTYEAKLEVFAPDNKLFLKETAKLKIPEGKELPFALPVWSKKVKFDGPAGEYRFVAAFTSGAYAAGGEIKLSVVAKRQPELKADVALIPGDERLESWFKKNKLAKRGFLDAGAEKANVILAGKVAMKPEGITKLWKRVEEGATAIFLTPEEPINTGATMPSAEWTVFRTFNEKSPDPTDEQMATIPEKLALGGIEGEKVKLQSVNGYLDLAPTWAATLERKVAYVFIPFKVDTAGGNVIHLGSDYWLKAWIDGKPVCDTMGRGNEGAARIKLHPAAAKLEKGEHLLAVKVKAGSCGWALYVYGPSACGNVDEKQNLESPSNFPWLPLKRKGRIDRLDMVSGFYHREDWAKKHPIFEGLPSGGFMDWNVYGHVVPRGGYCFVEMDEPDEAVCGGINTAYNYCSGLYLSVFKHGKGRIIMNNLRIAESLESDPTANRVLENMLNYAAKR